jgi:hypothetical protein
MTAEKKLAFAGLSLADELKDFDPPAAAPPPKADPVKLREMSTQAGFPSREPQPLPSKPAPRPLLYDNRLTLRVAEEDKARFEELVYRLRASNGEAFKLALDALTATLQDKPLS